MLANLLKKIKEHKEELLVLVALLTVVAILGHVFEDTITILASILLLLFVANLDNISEYVSQRLEEKQKQQDQAAYQMQTIQSTVTDVIYRGLSGQFGKTIGAIPPGTVMDICPTSIPPVLKHNGVTLYRCEVHRNPGSQPMTTSVMKNLLNGHLKKVSISGVLPPKPGSIFPPYFYAVEVTQDTNLPDTFIFHIVYIDNSFTEAFVENHMCEESECWRRKLVDSQTPDDEDF